MRHLREFEEWNPDEWDDDTFGQESSDMEDIGFDMVKSYVITATTTGMLAEIDIPENFKIESIENDPVFRTKRKICIPHLQMEFKNSASLEYQEKINQVTKELTEDDLVIETRDLKSPSGKFFKVSMPFGYYGNPPKFLKDVLGKSEPVLIIGGHSVFSDSGIKQLSILDDDLKEIRVSDGDKKRIITNFKYKIVEYLLDRYEVLEFLGSDAMTEEMQFGPFRLEILKEKYKVEKNERIVFQIWND